MSWLRRIFGAPWRLWARSLPFRVVVSVVVATIGVLALTGGILLDQSARGVLAAKTQESVSETASAIAAMQAELRSSDLRGSNMTVQLLAWGAIGLVCGSAYGALTGLSGLGLHLARDPNLPGAMLGAIVGSNLAAAGRWLRARRG